MILRPYVDPGSAGIVWALSGRALHTGGASTARVTRRPDDGRGLRLIAPGFAAPLEARDLAALRRSARRSTVLEDPRGDEGRQGLLRTPEHLLAAALFFADAPLDVALDGPEPPGLDGSARPWFEAFAAAAPPGFVPRAREHDVEMAWEHSGPEGELHAETAPRFSVTYAWNEGALRQAFTLEHAADAPDAVLAARTFIRYRDWKALRGASGLLEGADAGSGLLIAATEAEFAEGREALPEAAGRAFPLLHPERFRLEDEPARHKVLDLLGDLALNGLSLPRLRLTIVNGGHALHHLLLDALNAGRRPAGSPALRARAARNTKESP